MKIMKFLNWVIIKILHIKIRGLKLKHYLKEPLFSSVYTIKEEKVKVNEFMKLGKEQKIRHE